jgi:hypothetical protein
VALQANLNYLRFVVFYLVRWRLYIDKLILFVSLQVVVTMVITHYQKADEVFTQLFAHLKKPFSSSQMAQS